MWRWYIRLSRGSLADAGHAALQISLLSFRMQFIVAGPGLVPWMYDSQFVAGMTDYLGPSSGVGNLTIRNWAEVNLANFPVRPLPQFADHAQTLEGTCQGVCCSQAGLKQ